MESREAEKAQTSIDVCGKVSKLEPGHYETPLRVNPAFALWLGRTKGTPETKARIAKLDAARETLAAEVLLFALDCADRGHAVTITGDALDVLNGDLR